MSKKKPYTGAFGSAVRASTNTSGDMLGASTDHLYFGIIPHRPPSDAAVARATEKYVEDFRAKGQRPSPEWDAAHPPRTASGR